MKLTETFPERKSLQNASGYPWHWPEIFALVCSIIKPCCGKWVYWKCIHTVIYIPNIFLCTTWHILNGFFSHSWYDKVVIMAVICVPAVSLCRQIEVLPIYYVILLLLQKVIITDRGDLFLIFVRLCNYVQVLAKQLITWPMYCNNDSNQYFLHTLSIPLLVLVRLII